MRIYRALTQSFFVNYDVTVVVAVAVVVCEVTVRFVVACHHSPNVSIGLFCVARWPIRFAFRCYSLSPTRDAVCRCFRGSRLFGCTSIFLFVAIVFSIAPLDQSGRNFVLLSLAARVAVGPGLVAAWAPHFRKVFTK